MADYIFTPGQTKAILIVNLISTLLSVIGEVFMIYVYFKIPSMKKFSVKLIVSLMVGNFIYGLANLCTYFQLLHDSCNLEGVLRTIGYMSAIFWALTILIISYYQLKQFNPRIEEIYNSLLLACIVISIIPGTFVITSEIIHGPARFGSSLSFCAIEPLEYALIFTSFPVWIGIIASFVYTGKFILLIRERYETRNIMEYKQIFLYAMILALTWIPDMINRLCYWFVGRPYFSIMIMHIFFTRIAGFLNALVFGKSVHCAIKSYYERKSMGRTVRKELSMEAPNLSIVFELI